jgi:hypothetical protein
MIALSSKQLVVDAWQAFATRDPGQVRVVFAPDAEWLVPPGNATALALDGEHHLVGRERIVQFLTSDFGRVFVAGVSVDFAGSTPTAIPSSSRNACRPRWLTAGTTTMTTASSSSWRMALSSAFASTWTPSEAPAGFETPPTV